MIGTMNSSPSPTTTTDLESNIDQNQNLPPSNRHICNVYTQKPHHKNVEQLLDQDQYQLPSRVDDSSTQQSSGNSELPSGTPIFSDLDLPIAIRKGVRSTVLKQEDDTSTSHPISHHVSFETLPPTYKAFMTSLNSNPVSFNWKEAMQDLKWRKTMFEEIRALVKNDTWDMVPKPYDKNAVGCKWVYTIKHTHEGNVERFKTKLVVKGHTQTYGVNYEETFALVAKINIVRTLISCAVNFRWDLF
jgi:Reverse transcriptase (RNA-dependent DNA polymerase)